MYMCVCWGGGGGGVKALFSTLFGNGKEVKEDWPAAVGNAMPIEFLHAFQSKVQIAFDHI